MKINQERKKIEGIIFLKSMLLHSIVIYHYFCHSKGEFKLLFRTANSNLGFIFVTSFFSISGSVLYYNYPEIKLLKEFYFKRWKSIFPSFYICYFCCLLKKIIKNKNVSKGKFIKIFFYFVWNGWLFKI